jgi:hypothetical protein
LGRARRRRDGAGHRHHRRYEALTRELDRLCCRLSHRNLGDIVTAGLVAAFENDLNKDGTFHLSDIKRHATTFDSLWTLLRLGGFRRPKDLEAFWYSTTPPEIAAKETAQAAELRVGE